MDWIVSASHVWPMGGGWTVISVLGHLEGERVVLGQKIIFTRGRNKPLPKAYLARMGSQIRAKQTEGCRRGLYDGKPDQRLGGRTSGPTGWRQKAAWLSRRQFQFSTVDPIDDYERVSHYSEKLG